ncbi:MAG: hypothetical protein U0T75_10235 [Chitinophagales bacterium]
MIKFGLDQLHKPAPAWMERAINALIMLVMPALATFVLTIPDAWLSAEVKNFLGAGATFSIAVLKALLFLFGEQTSTNH